MVKKKLAFLSIFPILISCSSVSYEKKKHYTKFIIYNTNEAIAPLNTECVLTTYLKYKENELLEIYDKFDNEIISVHKIADSYHQYDVPGVIDVNATYNNDDQIEVNDYLFDLFKKGIELTKLTEGYFNISIGSIIDVWKDKFDNSSIYQSSPSSIKITKAKSECYTYEEIDEFIILNENKKTITLNSKKDISNIKINFGAISKGYALSKVCSSLNNDPYIISLGQSSIALKGEYPSKDRDYFIVNIVEPKLRNNDSSVSSLGKIKSYGGESLSTSGDYQKYFIDKSTGEVRSHIINPKTGYSSSYYAEINLISKCEGYILDSLSTALMNIEDIYECKRIINKVENFYSISIDYSFIKRNNSSYQIYCSSSYNDRFIEYNKSLVDSISII